MHTNDPLGIFSDMDLNPGPPRPAPVMRLFEVTVLGPDGVEVVRIAAHFIEASNHLTFIDLVGEGQTTQYHHIFNASCWKSVRQVGVVESGLGMN